MENITSCDSSAMVFSQNIEDEGLMDDKLHNIKKNSKCFFQNMPCVMLLLILQDILLQKKYQCYMIISGFLQYLRHNFLDVTISLKLHMMEDHIIPFITRWGAGCGFFGEQGIF